MTSFRNLIVSTVVLVSACSADSKNEEREVDWMTAEDSRAAYFEQLLASEVLELHLDTSELPEADPNKFEGEGDLTFWHAGAGCLGGYTTQMSSHTSILTAPSENSDIYKSLNLEKTDPRRSDVGTIDCMRSNSRDDFFVRRVDPSDSENPNGEYLNPISFRSKP